MSYYFGDRFVESVEQRAKNEGTLIRSGNYLPDVLSSLVLEYSCIDKSGLKQLLDMIHTFHIMGDMSVSIGGQNRSCVLHNRMLGEWTIPFNIHCAAINMSFHIPVEDVMQYVKCGDIAPESDAMRVICETFGYIGTDYAASLNSGVLMMRSFFDYCIWPINRIDAPARLHVADSYDSDDDSDGEY